MKAGQEFFNLYNHDLARVAVAVPALRVADPRFNAEQTIALMRQAAERRAAVVLFPELGLSAYSNEDLFHQRALLDASLDALQAVLHASETLPLVAVVGLPLQVDHLLYNCGAVLHRGRLLGLVPKTYLPNYREFYEARQFTSAEASIRTELDLLGQRGVPFGTRLLFQAEDQPLLTLFVEVCEDLWVPIPPSSHATLAGATLVLNLSASNVTIGKAEYRHQLVGSQSARCIAGYLYSAAGPGESTTDLAWDGHAVVYENGTLLAESRRFSYEPQLVCTELDLERLSQERMRQTTFGHAARSHRAELRDFRVVSVPLELPRRGRLLPERRYERFPYVPADPRTRDQRCEEVYHIQVQGLVKRLQATGIKKVVIGISGGLDSTQALLVCAQAMDVLGLPRTNILAYTMPGFATSARTLAQARRLMAAVGCSAHELDIRPSARRMLEDIGHPYARGEPVYDVTFENVQAGERTSHLFRLANLHDALVVGTSDLSELALGWTTYGVGDHMSHYAVNASVPKTLIQHVIRWVADTERLGKQASQVLYDVLATEISPELVPSHASTSARAGRAGAAGRGEPALPDGTGAAALEAAVEEPAAQPSQATEAVLGPYALHDFFLYYILRYGFAPPKVAFLAYCAWHDRQQGAWPNIPPELRREYDLGQIRAHLRTFLDRFFKLSQYKRSCIPNAPKVGSGGSLSPRGDYRAPSDSEATPWLDQLELVPLAE